MDQVAWFIAANALLHTLAHLVNYSLNAQQTYTLFEQKDAKGLVWPSKGRIGGLNVAWGTGVGIIWRGAGMPRVAAAGRHTHAAVPPAAAAAAAAAWAPAAEGGAGGEEEQPFPQGAASAGGGILSLDPCAAQ